jgi:CheY-like chemotaxis protein
MHVARILVVEDNDPVRWTLAALLRFNGYEVDQATNGQQALARFASCPTDAILMDLHMPVMDGLKACRLLRQTSQVPILMISTFNNATIEKQLLDCGANGIVPKPLEFDAVLGWVRSASASKGISERPVDPDSSPIAKSAVRPSNQERSKSTDNPGSLSRRGSPEVGLGVVGASIRQTSPALEATAAGCALRQV